MPAVTGYGGSGLKLAFHAVALALDNDRLCMVEEAVENGRGKGGIIVEDARPVLVGSVGSNDDRPLFIAEADDLEEQVGAAFIDGKEPQFVKLC